MLTNRVPHIFKNYNPPVIYGSLNIQKTIEQPPQCTLNIQYIPKHKIRDYIKTYAEYGKLYTFYGSTFLVDSYQESISSTPHPDFPQQRIETYDLQIKYKAYVAVRGTNYTTAIVIMPATTSNISAVPFKTVAAEAGIESEGLDFVVRRPEFNEISKLFSYPVLELALQYSKLYGHYVFLDRGDRIIFKPLAQGAKHVITNSLKYRLIYRQINTERPVILEDCFTNPLYEEYDEYFNTESANLPYYVPKPLPYAQICTTQRTGERPVIPQTIFVNTNSSNANIILQDSQVRSWETNLSYPSGSESVKCTEMLGNNVISEFEAEYTYDYPRLAIGGLLFRDTLFKFGTYAPPVIYSSPNYNLGSDLFTAIARRELTSLKETSYVYVPIDYKKVYTEVDSVKIKVIDGTGEYFVKPTLVNSIYANKKYLAAIRTTIINRERINKKTNSIEQDIYELNNEIYNLRIKMDELSTNFSINSNGVDLEEKLEYNFAKLELEKQLAKLFYLKELSKYIQYLGFGIYYYYVSLYNVDKENLVPGQLVRARPEEFGVPAVATDVNGFAYYIVVDPNWVPPLWVFKELNHQLTEVKTFVNPSNIDVFFERSYKANYIKQKLNLIINDTCDPHLTSEMPTSLGSLDPENLAEEYRADPEIINLASQFYKAITTPWEPNIVRGWDTRVEINRRLSIDTVEDIEVQTGNKIQVPREAYIETINEQNQNYANNSSISRSQSSFILGQPPAPKIFEQPYVALDARLQRPDRFIYRISTPNLTPYLSLGNLQFYKRRRQPLPDFPTTAFTKYRVALETSLALEEMQSYKVYSIQLFGLFDKIDTGDYIQINDIPELAVSNLRVNIIDFTIDFKGTDPDNELIAICDATKIIAGEFYPKTITWTKERVNKLGSTQYYVYKL